MDNFLFKIEEIPAGPDYQGFVHLIREGRKALCGAELTGDVVPEDCPLDCPMCEAELV